MPRKANPDEQTVVLSFRVKPDVLDAAVARCGSRKALTDKLISAVEKYAARESSTARHPSARGTSPSGTVTEVNPRWKTEQKK